MEQSARPEINRVVGDAILRVVAAAVALAGAASGPESWVGDVWRSTLPARSWTDHFAPGLSIHLRTSSRSQRRFLLGMGNPSGVFSPFFARQRTCRMACGVFPIGAATWRMVR